MIATSKMVGSIDREVRAFIADLRDHATRLATENPETGLKVLQAPDKILLQAADVGVTVSLFRSRAGEAAGAEVVLSVWNGNVVFPGTTPVAGQRAEHVSDRSFHIVAIAEDGDGSEGWLWNDGTDKTITSSTLAEICVEEMAGRLPEIAAEIAAAEEAAGELVS